MTTSNGAIDAIFLKGITCNGFQFRHQHRHQYQNRLHRLLLLLQFRCLSNRINRMKLQEFCDFFFVKIEMSINMDIYSMSLSLSLVRQQFVLITNVLGVLLASYKINRCAPHSIDIGAHHKHTQRESDRQSERASHIKWALDEDRRGGHASTSLKH